MISAFIVKAALLKKSDISSPVHDGCSAYLLNDDTPWKLYVRGVSDQYVKDGPCHCVGYSYHKYISLGRLKEKK